MAIMQVNFYSQKLKRSTTFMAILPVDGPGKVYNKDEFSRTLKSLYLLHGYAGNFMDWLWGARIVKLSLKYNVAIFLPSGENSFYLDDEIKEEYFGEFIGREIIEFTRSIFPIPCERQKTFIGGLSMGGYGALRNGLKYHEVFGGIIALSSALIVDHVMNMTPDYKNNIASFSYYKHVFGEPSKLKGSDKDIKALASKLKQEGKDIPKIFMACGKNDFLINENKDLYNYLKNENIDVEYIEDEGQHDWNFWDKYIKVGLEWMSKIS